MTLDIATSQRVFSVPPPQLKDLVGGSFTKRGLFILHFTFHSHCVKAETVNTSEGAG